MKHVRAGAGATTDGRHWRLQAARGECKLRGANDAMRGGSISEAVRKHSRRQVKYKCTLSLEVVIATWATSILVTLPSAIACNGGEHMREETLEVINMTTDSTDYLDELDIVRSKL